MSVTGHIIGNWNLTGEVNETGEGANVVPNPPEEATDTLEKIGIDDVVYSITGEQEQADWDQSDPTAVDYIKNKPTIPAAQVNSDWNAASGVAQILNKPTIPAAQVNSDWNAVSGVAQILNKPTIPAAQVNSDWNAVSGVAQILNKPTLATVATSGEASDVSYDNSVSGMTATDVQDAVDELKSNLMQLDGLTVYRNLTPQTSYGSFNDGSNLPLISLTTNIEPVQAGSGDPSPSNIRPISGFTEANVTRCGKNIWGGLPLAQAIQEVSENPTLDVTNKTLAFANSKNIGGSYNHSISNSAAFKENTQYTIVLNYRNSADNNCIRVRYTDNSVDYIYLENSSDVKNVKVFVTNQNKSVKELILGYVRNGLTYLYYEECGVFEDVITTQDFEPYNGQTYNVEFKDGDNPLTVYGGTLDVVSGVLTITDEYIASYNGETLPATWISDRDVYAEGTTPTTGAEVVYELATPQTYQLTPTQVNSLLGQNYIFSDTGNVTNVKYIGVLNFS